MSVTTIPINKQRGPIMAKMRLCFAFISYVDVEKLELDEEGIEI